MYDPLPSGTFTDPYGPRGVVPGLGDLGFHTGLDKAAAAGTPIYAAHSGRVSRKWWDAFANGAGAGGNMVAIAGDDGYETRYAHMQSQSPLSVGDRVVGGQTVIGYVGRSGAATGNHLHFEALKAGKFVDPKPLITNSAPTLPEQKEDEEMKRAMYYSKGGIQYVIIGEPLSGWAYEYTTRDSKFNNTMAALFQTGDFVSVDESIYNAFKRSLADVRNGGAVTATVQIEGSALTDAAKSGAEAGAKAAVSGLTLKAQ